MKAKDERKVNHNSYNNYDFFLTTAQPFLKYFFSTTVLFCFY